MELHGTLPAITGPALPPIEIIAASFLVRYQKITRDIYSIHLRHWFDWCLLHNIDPLRVTRAHIEMWARQLAEVDGRKPRTVAGKLNAVCGLYKFAHLDGYLPNDPAAHVRRPKIEFISSTNALTRPQLADLLKAAEKRGPTAHAMICLFALNGLRISECLGADIEHLGHQRGFRTLHLPHRKGGKVGTVSLAICTMWAVEQACDGRQTGPILIGKDGTRLKVGACRRLLRNLLADIGVDKRVTPHGLRHTYATMSLDAGVAERDIVDSAGWSDPRMLRYYDRNRGAVERNPTHAVAAFVGAAA